MRDDTIVPSSSSRKQISSTAAFEGAHTSTGFLFGGAGVVWDFLPDREEGPRSGGMGARGCCCSCSLARRALRSPNIVFVLPVPVFYVKMAFLINSDSYQVDPEAKRRNSCTQDLPVARMNIFWRSPVGRFRMQLTDIAAS